MNSTSVDDRQAAQAVRRDNSLYEPPPPADVEEMKKNKRKEQKAFALLKEIMSKSKHRFLNLSGDLKFNSGAHRVD